MSILLWNDLYDLFIASQSQNIKVTHIILLPQKAYTRKNMMSYVLIKFSDSWLFFWPWNLYDAHYYFVSVDVLKLITCVPANYIFVKINILKNLLSFGKSNSK